MEHEIITSQNEKKAKEAATAEEDASLLTADESSDRIARHLEDASQLATDHEYSKALDEVAKAFLLDPLNETVQRFESQLQNEFHEYQEELHKKQEQESLRNAINKHQVAGEHHHRGNYEYFGERNLKPNHYDFLNRVFGIAVVVLFGRRSDS